MEISSTTVQPLSIAPARQDVPHVGEMRGREATLSERGAQIPARQAPVLIDRYSSPMNAERGYHREVGHPSHYAIQAYTALEKSEQREYMSTVLGIDEYA